METEIKKVIAREILDSRGNPTVEAEVILENGCVGTGKVPSGASTGKYEAVELRDGGKRYKGKGVLHAVENINTVIYENIKGMDVNMFSDIDRIMIELDGTKDKGKLGANAILATSLAVVSAAAASSNKSIYQILGNEGSIVLPVPMMNILNGGVHARNNLDFQEFMIMPVSACCFAEALRMGTEVYHSLREVLAKKGLSCGVGDEGGFAPNISNAYEAFELIEKAVLLAGYEPGKDICYAMDAASSELYQADGGRYFFPGENSVRSSDEMIEYYEKLIDTFPLVSIEDGLDENDWEGWKKMTDMVGHRVQLVGDDLFVTNTNRLEMGISLGCANAILIKMNQIGTVTETIKAISMAHMSGYNAIISHRSGETEDTFISDLAVALNAGQIKTGAPCRSERTAKYNRLLKIEEELGDRAKYKGKDIFKK